MGITVVGAQETAQRLEGVAERAVDDRAFWLREAEHLEAVIDTSYATRTSPAGESWPQTRGKSKATNRLATAHIVEPEVNGLTVRVPPFYSSFQFFGTKRFPGRNPLPFQRVGRSYVVPQQGRAAAWWNGLLERLKAYWVNGAL